MGKTTLFHPISLHVIRGAAESQGWQLGRISQLWIAPERNVARYRVEIQKLPNDIGAAAVAPDMVRSALQEAFAADIVVKWVKSDTRGRLQATIETTV